MQEVSQGSLKLQAHHDKIFNKGSQSMKNNFLQQQIYYLTQLRDHCKTLQITLKPNSNITIQRIHKLIDNLRDQLLIDVVQTRRETSLAEIPMSQFFQQTLDYKYQQGVLNLDKRLQRMQQLVQRQQDRNRANPVVEKLDSVNFKSVLIKKLIEEFIKKNDSVRVLIKYKLILDSKLKEKAQKCKKNYFVNANQTKMTQRQYFFQRNHKKLYTSKTIPSRMKLLTKRVQIIKKSSSRGFDKYSFNSFQQMQKSIFQQELDSVKFQNMRLQKSIDTLKLAISQRQNNKMLKMLSTHKELQTEESKARELLFYMLNNQKLSEKIKSCSFIWANKYPNVYHKNIFKSNEECQQQERKTQLREISKFKVKRSPSLNVNKIKISKDLLEEEKEENKEQYVQKWNQFKKQMKLYLLRSNEKTSQSMQCVDAD